MMEFLVPLPIEDAYSRYCCFLLPTQRRWIPYPRWHHLSRWTASTHGIFPAHVGVLVNVHKNGQACVADIVGENGGDIAGALERRCQSVVPVVVGVLLPLLFLETSYTAHCYQHHHSFLVKRVFQEEVVCHGNNMVVGSVEGEVEEAVVHNVDPSPSSCENRLSAVGLLFPYHGNRPCRVVVVAVPLSAHMVLIWEDIAVAVAMVVVVLCFDSAAMVGSHVLSP